MAQSDSTFPQPSKRRGRPRASEVAAQLGESAPLSSFPDGPTDADGLTLQQRRILEMIKATVERRGYPPSIREIGDRVGISSTSVVDYNLRVLERDGYIRRDREVSRAKDFAGFTDAELDEARAAIARLSWDTGWRRTRRWTSGDGRAVRAAPT